jgi:hypothetical protein
MPASAAFRLRRTAAGAGDTVARRQKGGKKKRAFCKSRRPLESTRRDGRW